MRMFFTLSLLTLYLLQSTGVDALLVDDYTAPGNKNLMQGRRGIFQKPPSSASSSRTDRVHASENASLKILYDKKNDGWCGFYTRFNVDDEYFDASSYEYIAFYILGGTGDVNFKVGIADKAWDKKGDSIKGGTIKNYLGGDLLADVWQPVLIPLSDFKGIKTSELSSLSFVFDETGKGKLYVDDIMFLSDESELPPVPEKAKVSADETLAAGSHIPVYFDDRNHSQELFPKDAGIESTGADGKWHLDIKSPERNNIEVWVPLYYETGENFDKYNYYLIRLKSKNKVDGLQFGLLDADWLDRGEAVAAKTPEIKKISEDNYLLILNLETIKEDVSLSDLTHFSMMIPSGVGGEFDLISSQLSEDKELSSGVSKPVGDYFVIWNFNSGIKNRLEGLHNQFVRPPSSIKVKIQKKITRGKGGRALKLDYVKKEKGFCGWWMHLFDNRVEGEKQYLDATEYPYLSFWVKGERGGENFSIQAADAGWVVKEDSVKAGAIGEYLTGGVTTGWQEVIVPLEDFPGLDASEMGGVTINFDSIGEGVVYLDDFSLKKSKTVLVPETELAREEEVVVDLNKINTAMWVWITEPILNDAGKRKELIDFCRERNINELFFQLQYKFVNPDDPEKIKTITKFPEAQKRAFREFHESGIKVHALDGSPDFVMRENHYKVLSEIEAVLEYNMSVAEEERWDGVHLDNEPYQMPGWKDLAQRQSISIQFLELNQKCMDFIKESGQKLEMGIDVPFWFDEIDFETKKMTAEVEWGGERKSLIYHLIDILDNVGIMDYRTFAGGADGTVIHGRGEVEYATKVNKKVYIGLETIGPDKNINEKYLDKMSFFGRSLSYMKEVMQETAEAYYGESGFYGFGIHYYKTYRDIK